MFATNDIFAVPQEHYPYLFNDGSKLLWQNPCGDESDYPDTITWLTAGTTWSDLFYNRYMRHYNEQRFEDNELNTRLQDALNSGEVDWGDWDTIFEMMGVPGYGGWS